ncbi:LTA synthase family protein [Candidatus Uhrbacteria bacterium]|nr:LTA synthase family protein [Candidatus Uhrbacteria bacterium]
MPMFLSTLFTYIRIVRLPIVLAVLFVIQNQAFTYFLHIVPQLYFRASVVTFALGMLIYGLAVLLPSRIRLWYLLFVSLVTSFLFIAQYIYYTYFEGFFQVTAFKYASQSTEIAGAISILLSPVLLIFIVHVFLVVFVMIYVHKKKCDVFGISGRKKIITALLLIVITVSGYGYLIFTEKRDWGHIDRLYSRPYDIDSLVAKIGIINYFVEDAVRVSLRKKGVSKKEKEFALAWKRTEREYPYPKQYFGAARGRNLILIQIESFENAVIGEKIRGVEITPNLNALIQEGLYVKKYFAYVNQGNTADAEFTVLNSLYVPPTGVAFFDYANNRYGALPALLAQHGYGTYVFHGDVLTFWNRANIYPKLGYQKWFTADDYTIPRVVGFQGLGDEDFFLQSAEKIKPLKQPFMAMLMTLTSHTPYRIPEDLQKITIPKDSNLDQLQKDYVQSAHYADMAVGVFIKKLKEMKIYDNSLIVIFGDHGSYSNISSALGVSKDIPEQLRNHQVPLIVVAPKSKIKGTISLPASHLDIYPTVANLLGVTPPRNIFGKDILNVKDSAVVKRKVNSIAIDAILGSRLTYIGSSDTIFDHGICEETSSNKVLPVEACRGLYEKETKNMRASDIVVRGDLIPLIQKLPAQKAELAGKEKKGIE